MAQDCAQVIQDALELTPAEAKLVIRDLQRKMAADRAAALNPQALETLAKLQADEYRRAGRLAKLRAQQTVIKLADLTARARRFDKPGDGVMAALVGHTRYLTVTAKVAGGLDSVAAHQLEMKGWALSGLRRDMEAGHHGIFRRLQRDSGFNAKVARELYSVHEGKGVTGDADAWHAAQVIEQWKERLRVLANQEGADIAKLPAHVVMQTHDYAKMVRAGYEKWRDAILPRLDVQRTFGGQDPDEVLRYIFDKIRRGESGVYAPEEHMGGGASLAQRLSSRRFLHFKGPDEWMAYNAEFGTGDLWEGTVRSLDHTARAVATMQRLGPNPTHTFRKLISAEAKAAQATGKEISGGYGAAIENTFSSLVGQDNVAASVRFAAIGSGLRQWQTMARLGRVLFASFSDIPQFAAAARYNGRGWLQSYGDAFAGLMNSAPKERRAEFAGYLGTFTDGVMGSMWGRIAADDMRPGKMAKVVNAYFRLNGLAQWTERLKVGHMWALGRVLGDHHRVAWGALDPYFQAQMLRYGIDAGEWGKLAKLAPGEEGGVRFLTPDLIEGADEALAHKVRAWMVNEAEFGVLTPGIRERSLLLQGTQPGTGPGELLRFMAQFKTFSTSVLLRSVPRAIDMRIPGVVHMAVAGTAFGYLALVAKDLASGKKPRDPTDPRTIAAAFTQSGGVGILGDMLMADFSDYGASLPDWAGGPVVGVASDMLEIYSRTVRGEDAKAKALYATLKQIPFANLFYLQSALQYLFIYQMQEDMNPGYLRRMERRMKRETGQEYIVPPSTTVRR